MRRIVTIVIIVCMMFSCNRTNKNKYTIIDSSGISYDANFYNKSSDGCIQFNDLQDTISEGPGTPTIVCEPYTIITNIKN